MAVKLTKLPKTQYSGLDYQNIMEDIVTLVTENPEYSDQYDDFLSSNAGRTITELFAYIADQLATRIDWVANENFLSTATQKSSIIRLLKLLGYNFELPINSTVTVTTKVDKPIGNFYLTSQYENDGNFSPYSLSVEDRNGVMKNFEALVYDSSIEKYNYKDGVLLQTGTEQNPNLTHYIEFHEGTTYIEQKTSNTDNNPIFILSQSPVTENSIQVYLVKQEGTSFLEEELSEVNSFLDKKAQNRNNELGEPNPLTYKLNVLENDTVSVEFPPTSLVTDSERRLREGDIIRIFYRTGGGVDGNITLRSINITKSLTVNNNSIELHFLNEEKGTGGRAGETTEHAAVYAPLAVRTANKAVTEEDYDIILNADNTIIKSKSFGNNSIAPSKVFDKYNLFIHPLEVWHFILKDKPGWEDVSPSRYKDFQWISLRLENRFNEEIAFRDGEFDKEVEISSSNLQWETSINLDGSGIETFYNFIMIETPDKFKKNFYNNSDFLFKLTESKRNTNFFDSLSTYNEFQEEDTTNNGLIEGSTPTWQITQKIPARLKSEVDVSLGVDASNKNVLSIGFDNNPTIVDIDISGADPSNTSGDDIITNINNAFKDSSNYNSGTTGNGYQELGLSVNSTSSAGLSDNTEYSIYINGYEKIIETGTNTTYAELATKLQESLQRTIIGDINAQSTKITNVQYDIEKIEPGMTISGTGIDSGTTVTNVSIPEKSITLSDAATLSNDNETITVSGYEVTIEGASPNQDIRIKNIGCYPKHSVRIEPGLTGNDLLDALSTTVDIPVAGSGKSGEQQLGSPVGSLSNTTDYYFKINGYEYSITTETDDSYNQIITLLDDALDPNYTVEATGTDDIKFVNNTSGPVLLEAGVSGNDLFEGLLGADYTLSTPIGGGDYSSVAKLTDYNEQVFIELISPCRGKASTLVFEETTDNSLNASELLFNLLINTGETKTMYGEKRLSVITNTGSTNFGNLIFENGSINLPLETDYFYINYLIDNKDGMDIGRYHNENFDTSDPSWRIVADRIYNTVYDEDRETLDLNLSDFEIRLTKNKVTTESLFAINNDWSLTEASNAEVVTLTDPQTLVDSSNYNLNIGFDDKGLVQIDITGNLGFDAGGDGYTINQLVNNINVEIQGDSNYSDDLLYANYSYASLNETEDKIIITSPLKTNESKITISQSTINDCVLEVFGLTEGVTYNYYAQGDYYIDHETEKIIYADTETGSDTLTNFNYKLSRLREGMEVSGTGIPNDTTIVEIDEDANEVTISNEALSDNTNVGLTFKGFDIMTFNKLGNSENIPDLPIYLHFIFDKRIKENLYDGENGNPGFALGTIDEDIYEDSISSYKIVGLNHIYKEPSFQTFDIKGTIYYNKIYFKDDIKNRVEKKLRENFNLENLDFGEGISRSKILSMIQNISGVDYTNIDFLGTDAQDPSTDVVNIVETDFNQITVLSEDILYAGQKIHGLILNYIISE